MQKRVIKIIPLLIAALILLAAQPGWTAKINWQQTYSEALKVSKDENKPIMMVFTADWCVFCKKLDVETFQDPAVANYVNANFVAVKIDRDKETQIVKDFKVQGIPDLYFLEPYKVGENVKPMARQLGYVKPEPFLAGLKQIVAGLEAVQNIGNLNDLSRQE